MTARRRTPVVRLVERLETHQAEADATSTPAKAPICSRHVATATSSDDPSAAPSTRDKRAARLWNDAVVLPRDPSVSQATTTNRTGTPMP